MDPISLNTLLSSNIADSHLFRHLVGHQILRLFFSLGRKRKGRRLSRSARKKIINRRRRWFTDNIIMHHKRLHDKNRETIISDAKSLVLSRKLSKNKKKVNLEGNATWRDRVEVKDRGRIIRGRISAKKSRARSRWLSVADISIG